MNYHSWLNLQFQIRKNVLSFEIYAKKGEEQQARDAEENQRQMDADKQELLKK